MLSLDTGLQDTVGNHLEQQEQCHSSCDSQMVGSTSGPMLQWHIAACLIASLALAAITAERFLLRTLVMFKCYLLHTAYQCFIGLTYSPWYVQMCLR
jgi:hypothetical protein